MIVIAAGRAAHDRNRFSPVFGTIQSDVGHVNNVSIAGIDRDAVEVPGTTSEARIGICKDPSISTVVGTIKACLLRLNECVDALAISCDCNTHTSPVPVR